MGDRSHRTQAERRAETEQRVLAAAMRLIAAGGSRSVSLADIGREAGYSRGIVTHMFGTKQQLLAALAEAAQQDFSVTPREGGLDHVVATVESYLGYLRDRTPVGQAFLLLWAEAVAGDPGLRPIFAERDASFRETIAGQLQRGVADGSIRPDADPVAVAVSIAGLLRGIGMQLMLTPQPELYTAICDAAVEMIRRGLAADHSRHPPGR